jgi:predicted phosphodiesterase
MIKLQYISDIHLEHLKVFPVIKKYANNLCLLGDIGSPYTKIYKDFILDCSNRFKNVFVIFGNHEYYSIKTRLEPKQILCMSEMEQIMETIPQNVKFLNNSCVYLNKSTEELQEHGKDDCIKIIGSTLWSDIDLNVAKGMNDYNYISTTSTTSDTYNDQKIL